MYKGLVVKMKDITESLLVDFEDTMRLLKKGQFKSCLHGISGIRSKMMENNVSYHVVFDYLLQLNSYVCQKMLAKTSQRENEKFENNVETLLQNMQGIPPTMAAMEIELMIVYNSSFDFIGNRKANLSGTVSLLSCIEKSLLRLCSVLEIHLFTNLCQLDSVVPVLQAILLRKEDLSLSLVKILGFVCCVSSWLLLIQERCHEALKLVTLYQDTVGVYSDDKMIEDIIIEPLMCDTLPGLQLPDFFHLTTAYCFILCGRNTEAMPHLRNVCNEEWKSRIHYVLACLLLSSNQVNEAFCMAKSSLASDSQSISSLWRSKFFNLIGCCLAKQGKPHSAVECFRKAIVEEPIQLLPLVNIISQYRVLQSTDAEMKGLTILLQEIQDREDHEQMQDECSVVASDPLRLLVNLRITKADVFYILGKRLQESGSIDQSVATYMQLLDCLKTTPHNDCIWLPSLLELYKETICAMYLASRHADCLALCERVFEDCPQAFTDIEVGMLVMTPVDPHMVGLNTHLKLDPMFEGPRNSKLNSCCLDSRVIGCTILMVKALALGVLGDNQKAVDILKRVRMALSIASNKENALDMPKKKPRFEGIESNLSEKELEGWSVLSSLVHSCLGSLQLQLGNHQDAVYLLHTAIVKWPDNLEGYFHYAKLLIKEGQTERAKKTWIDIRSRLIEPLLLEKPSFYKTYFFTLTRQQLLDLDKELN